MGLGSCHPASHMLTKQQSRRYVRVKLSKRMLVAWEYGGARNVSFISVLALGGLFISTPEPPTVGDVIRLIFDVPEGEVRARARVCNRRPGQGMGIEFIQMLPEARAKLTRLVKSLSN